MSLGSSQEMAIGIGKAIEQDKRQLVSIKKEKILVCPGTPARLEKTVTDLWGFAEDMFNSPGSPERFHKSSRIFWWWKHIAIEQICIAQGVMNGRKWLLESQLAYSRHYNRPFPDGIEKVELNRIISGFP